MGLPPLVCNLCALDPAAADDGDTATLTLYPERINRRTA